MEAKKPVFWHQGLFLQPQHFQQNDLYFQSLLAPLQRHQQPYFWGVCDMQLQEASLANETFEIIRGEFILKDGTWVSFPGNAVIQPRSFKGAWPEMEKPMKVYIGLRKWNRTGANVASADATDDLGATAARFLSPLDPPECQDLYAGGPTAQVRMMTYLLKIFWEGEIDRVGDYDLISIAQLKYDGRSFQLNPDFVPPTVSLTVSNTLTQMIRSIREQVMTRCHLLGEYKMPDIFQSGSGEGGDMGYLLALSSLNRYLPLLNHLVETPTVHPWQVYGLLRQLIGELSTYTERIDACGRLRDGTELLPRYDHEDLGACFHEADTLIGELLGQLTVGAENVVYLVRDGDFFRASVPAESFDSPNNIYLILKAPGDLTETAELVFHMAKMSSEQQMPNLIKRALPGMLLELQTAPPPGSPRRADALYFKLDRSSSHWSDMQRHQNLCLHWNNAPEETTAEIIILKRRP